jgi:hypothetical protein
MERSIHGRPNIVVLGVIWKCASVASALDMRAAACLRGMGASWRHADCQVAYPSA